MNSDPPEHLLPPDGGPDEHDLADAVDVADVEPDPLALAHSGHDASNGTT